MILNSRFLGSNISFIKDHGGQWTTALWHLHLPRVMTLSDSGGGGEGRGERSKPEGNRRPFIQPISLHIQPYIRPKAGCVPEFRVCYFFYFYFFISFFNFKNFIYLFIYNFYCYSIAIVCIFSPPLHPIVIPIILLKLLSTVVNRAFKSTNFVLLKANFGE